MTSEFSATTLDLGQSTAHATPDNEKPEALTDAVGSRDLRPAPKRRGNPNWRKGVSSNPRGRPKLTAEQLWDMRVKRDLKSAARDHTPEAMRVILGIMRDDTVAPQYRLSAAQQILDRGHGKAVSQTEISISVYDKLSDSELIKFITGSDSAAPPIIDGTVTRIEDQTVDDAEFTDVTDDDETEE